MCCFQRKERVSTTRTSLMCAGCSSTSEEGAEARFNRPELLYSAMRLEGGRSAREGADEERVPAEAPRCPRRSRVKLPWEGRDGYWRVRHHLSRWWRRADGFVRFGTLLSIRGCEKFVPKHRK